jgi:hypothetical protein
MCILLQVRSLPITCSCYDKHASVTLRASIRAPLLRSSIIQPRVNYALAMCVQSEQTRIIEY